MKYIVRRQAAEFLIVLDQLVDLLAEKVDVLLVTDDLYLVASGYQPQLRKMLPDDFQIRIVYTEKLYRIEGVDWNDYFAQFLSFFNRETDRGLFTTRPKAFVSSDLYKSKTIYF